MDNVLVGSLTVRLALRGPGPTSPMHDASLEFHEKAPRHMI